MYKYLLDFIDTNNILSPYQIVLQKNILQNHSVITLVHKISTALDSGMSVVGCYIDLKKGFDKVDHKILPKKKIDLYIDGNASKPHISIFAENKIFTEICFDTNLYKASMACTKIRMQIL